MLIARTRSARTCLGRGYMRYDGEGSVDECPGSGSGAWSNTTYRGPGCSTRIRINALRYDSRQEPYALVSHVRICAGGGSPRPFKSLTSQERKLLRRRQAIEPNIGHLKADHRMDRCHLKGEQGGRLHAVLCTAGYNIR